MPANATSARVIIAERLIGEGVVALAIVAWWLAARGVPEFILPGPVAVGRRLVELFVTPEFLFHMMASAWRVLIAIAVAMLIGGGLAFLARIASSPCSTRFPRSVGPFSLRSGSIPAISA